MKWIFDNYMLTIDRDSEDISIEAWDDGRGETYRGRISLSELLPALSLLKDTLTRW